MNSEKYRKQKEIALLDILWNALDADQEVIEAMPIEEVRADLQAMGFDPNEELPNDLKRLIAAQSWKKTDVASAQPADQAGKSATGTPPIAQSGVQSLAQPIIPSAQWRMDVEIGRDHKDNINKISYRVAQDSLSRNGRQRRAPISLMKIALAAAFLIFIVFIGVTFLPRLFQSRNQQIVRQPQSDDHKQSRPSVVPNESTVKPPEAAVPPRATTPTHNQADIVAEFAGYPESQSVAAETALSSGRIEVAPVMRYLAGGQGRTMGVPEVKDISFSVLSPNRAVIRAVRPLLKWKSLAGDAQYTIKIYDDNDPDPRKRYKSIDETKEPITETVWTPSKPLKRGHIYVWQVTVSGEQATGEGASLFAKGKFKILTQAELNELTTAEQVEPRSHLAMGVLYAKLGLLNEAERELKMASLQDERAKVLLQNLQQQHRRLQAATK